MEMIAKGKEAVLDHLEKEARERAGQDGVYALVRDPSAGLVTVIAGHIFSGDGSFQFAGTAPVHEWKVVKGIVVSIEPV